MRWKNFGEMSTDDGHKVNFSGEEDRHEYGVGYLVYKDVVDAVLGCLPVFSNINITIIQVYAPTSVMMTVRSTTSTSNTRKP